MVSGKGITMAFSTFVLCFYLAIVMYVFGVVLDADTLVNFASAMIFEIIGFVLLTYFVLGGIVARPIKTGYLIPLIAITVIYTIILDVLNMVCVANMSHTYFILNNLVVLFVYSLISVPMYIVGRR